MQKKYCAIQFDTNMFTAPAYVLHMSIGIEWKLNCYSMKVEFKLNWVKIEVNYNWTKVEIKLNWQKTLFKNLSRPFLAARAKFKLKIILLHKIWALSLYKHAWISATVQLYCTIWYYSIIYIHRYKVVLIIPMIASTTNISPLLYTRSIYLW